MAVRIPVYEQQTSPQGMLQAQANPERLIPAVNELPGAVGSAMEQFGQSMTHAVSSYADVQRRLDATEAATRVGNGISSANQEWLTNFEKSKAAAPVGASGFTEEFMGRFEKFAAESLANESDEHGRILLSQGLNSLRDRLVTHALDFEQKSRASKAVTDLESSIQTWGKTVYQNPSQYPVAKQEILKSIANMDTLDQVQKAELVRKYMPDVAQWATQGYINTSPGQAYDAIKTGERYPGGFDGAVAFTLKHEGSQEVTDSNGYRVRFGINKKWHPGVDLQTLTAEGAAAIYKKDYWDPIGGDKLAAKNPQLAMVAFDTAAMAGVAKTKQLLDKADGDPARLIELRAEFQQDLIRRNPKDFGRFAKSWENRNRDARNQLLPDGAPHVTGLPFIDDLAVDKFHTYQNMAETRYKQVSAVDDHAFVERVKNSVAMYQDGVLDPAPISRDEFVAKYGEAEGATRHAAYQQVQALGQNLNAMQSMPADEIRKVLDANNPRNQPGPGYEAASQRFALLLKSASQTIKVRDDDPADYVLKTAKPVQDAYAGMKAVVTNPASTVEQRTEATRRYADASMAEQLRLGVAKTNLLSKPYVDSIQDTFGKVQGEQMVQQVNALRDTWGTYWKDVYGQLVSKKAIPPAAIVIGSGMVGAPAVDLALASRIPDDDLFKGVEDSKTIKQDVTLAVDRALDPFRATMVGSDGKPLMMGGPETYATFYDQTRKLAMYYANQGMPAQDAAQKAATATVTDRYEFAGTYRVPKPIDAQAVSYGVEAYLANLKAESIQLPLTARRDPYVAVDALRRVKSGAYWVTNKDETGLNLYNAESRSAVLDADGKPIELTWDKIINHPAWPTQKWSNDPVNENLYEFAVP